MTWSHTDVGAGSGHWTRDTELSEDVGSLHEPAVESWQVVVVLHQKLT